jgi:hypothetical protein
MLCGRPRPVLQATATVCKIWTSEKGAHRGQRPFARHSGPTGLDQRPLSRAPAGSPAGRAIAGSIVWLPIAIEQGGILKRGEDKKAASAAY